MIGFEPTPLQTEKYNGATIENCHPKKTNPARVKEDGGKSFILTGLYNFI